MQRTVIYHLDLSLGGPAKLVFSVAVAADAPLAEEELTILADGVRVEPDELTDRHGTRLHVLQTSAGRVALDYRAVVAGRAAPAPVEELDLLAYLRPSRYCESDSLGPTAASEFAGLQDEALLTAVVDWVGSRLTYAAGSSLPTDGAVRTLLGRQGVCRDFAHLSVALLRALNVPARLVGAFAPGLSPMEYHAVCEAHVGGAWHVVDATHRAPRQSLLRVSTGRDAADTAFLTSFGGPVALAGLEVSAVVDELPVDDGTGLVQLG